MTFTDPMHGHADTLHARSILFLPWFRRLTFLSMSSMRRPGHAAGLYEHYRVEGLHSGQVSSPGQGVHWARTILFINK